MTSVTMQNKPTREALDQIYQTSPYGIGGHFLIVLIFGFLFLDILPTHILIVYLSIHILILLLRTYTVWKYNKIKTDIDNTDMLRRSYYYYILGVFATGLTWGLSFLLFYYDVPTEYSFFVYAILVGLAGAGIVTIGNILSIYLAFMLPMLGSFTVWSFFQESKINMVATVLLLGMMLFYYFTARRYSLHFAKAIIEKERAINAKYEIIQRLSTASELKDNETGMHITRMSHYAYFLALESGQSTKFSQDILYASAMHDVGKIGIPDHILLKEGRLDDNEFAIMQSHTHIGKELLGGSESELIKLSESIAYTHHEKYDGTGYPRGLKGKDIPIGGRITAICDVFDALVSKRPYKEGWSNDDAFSFIQEKSDIYFDPELVTHFINIKPKIIQFQRTHQD